MQVQELMSKNVECLSPRSSLRQAARKMRDLCIGSMPVVEDGQLLGIITDRDISCFAVAMGRDANYTEVQKVMNKDVITCFDDQDISEAAALMEAQHIRRLAVLSHDNTMAGFITVDDLARGSHQLAGAVLEAATPVH